MAHKLRKIINGMPAAPKVKPAANTWGGLLGLIKLFLFNNIQNRIFFACKSGSYASNSEASSAHAIFLNCQFRQIESFFVVPIVGTNWLCPAWVGVVLGTTLNTRKMR